VEAPDVDAGAADEEELDDVAAREAAATSVGTMIGLLLRGDKSTVPSWLMVSGFMPRKALVYAMFSAAYD
jgi:hypothetical protein